MRFHNDNAPTRFIVLDLEFLSDRQLYNRYRVRDPRPADMRWPFRRVVAASVMALEVIDQRLEVSAFKTFSGPAEDRLLNELFAFLRERPQHMLCTWGGASADMPVLRLAAMEHGLKLPPQLKPTAQAHRVHLDLAIALRGGAGEFVHMSEVATRLNIPSKLAGFASYVPQWAAQGNWRAVSALADADTVTTAMILAAHLDSQGAILSCKAGLLAIIRHVRPLRGREPWAALLGNTAERLKREISQEIDRWIARVA